MAFEVGDILQNFLKEK